MRSPVLPWVLLILVCAAWAATALRDGDGASSTTAGALREENRALQEEVARLRGDVDGLREAAPTPGPSLRGAETSAPPAAPRKEDPHAAALAERQRIQEERGRRWEAALALLRPWISGLESVGDRREREDAIAAIRAALDSSEPDMLLAGLIAASGLGELEYDREDFRIALLAHVHSEDSDVRRAARESLTTVNPQPEDLPMWAAEAKDATNDYAETVAGALVSSDGCRIQSRGAEEAVLHLLRDGTDINRSNLLRGLQSARSFSPRVEARIIELVRGERGRGSFMTGNFYHFLGNRLHPMSDAMLEMVLGHVATETYMVAALRCLQYRLSEDHKERVAARLLDLADSAGMDIHLYNLLEHFRYLDGHGDADRLQAFANDEEVPEQIRPFAARAAAAARQRQRR